MTRKAHYFNLSVNMTAQQQRLIIQNIFMIFFMISNIFRHNSTLAKCIRKILKTENQIWDKLSMHPTIIYQATIPNRTFLIQWQEIILLRFRTKQKIILILRITLKKFLLQLLQLQNQTAKNILSFTKLHMKTFGKFWIF